MTPSPAAGSGGQMRRWSDQIVRRCLEGDDRAWATLIERYQNLIFSIPIKLGFSQEDATDIFQAVCLELVTELPRIREPRALPKWLMRTTAHRCYRWQRDRERDVTQPEGRWPADVPGRRLEMPDEMFTELEREQALRDALAALAPRCQRLIQMLFMETPARPYREVAASLGIAVGSVGFIRMRCLDRLRELLTRMGF